MRIPPSLLTVSALVAQTSAPLPEAPMSLGERNQAQQLLTESRQALLKALTGLTPAQWAFKPAPDRWSIQECAEHIVTVEQVVQAQVVAKALAGPQSPQRRAEIKVTDGLLLSALPDRSHKVQAPEMVVPKGRLASREGVLTAGHTTRHVAQIEEVKRTAGYPAS